MIRIVLQHDRHGYIGSFEVTEEALNDDNLWSITADNLRRHCLLIVNNKKAVVSDGKRDYYE